MPLKTGFSTLRRPLYQIDELEPATTLSDNSSVVIPQEVETPVPFRSPGLRMPVLYHAGSAWLGTPTISFPEFDAELESNPAANRFLKYRPAPSSRPWGVTGRLIRTPRTVVFINPEFAEAPPTSVTDALDQAGASMLWMTNGSGSVNYSALTQWAIGATQRSEGNSTNLMGTPMGNGPISPSMWAAGDMLVIATGLHVYFDVSSLLAWGSSMDGGYSGITSTNIKAIPDNPGEFYRVYTDTAGVSYATAKAEALQARCGRFGGRYIHAANYYPSIQANDGDQEYSDSEMNSALNPATWWASTGGDAGWTRTQVFGKVYTGSDFEALTAAYVAAYVDAIESFWPEEFED